MNSPSTKKNAFHKTFSKYRNTEVLTANKEAVLLLLYEGAVRFLKLAIQAVEKRDSLEKSRLIGRTQDIINELSATLNYKTGGEIAGSLKSLYDFMSDRLVAGNQDNNIEKLNEALGILVTLQEAWQQAIASVKTENKTAEQR